MALQTVQRSAWLYGRRELVGGGFHGDGGPGFFRRQLAADQQRIGHSPGHGFGAVCVNDADHHRHLQLAGVFNGLTDELMQLVKGERPGLGFGRVGRRRPAGGQVAGRDLRHEPALVIGMILAARQGIQTVR